MGLTQSMAPFLALRFVGGGASAIVLVLASALVLERLAETRRTGLSALHFAGVGSGIAVSAVLVAAMLSAGQSWQSLWLASGVVSLIAAIAVALLVNEGTMPAVRASRAAGRATRSASGAPRRRLRSVRLRLRDHRDVPGRDRARRAGDPRAGAGDLGRVRPCRGAIGRAVGADRDTVRHSGDVRRRVRGRGGGRAGQRRLAERGRHFLAAILVGGTFMGLTALGWCGRAHWRRAIRGACWH